MPPPLASLVVLRVRARGSHGRKKGGGRVCGAKQDRKRSNLFDACACGPTRGVGERGGRGRRGRLKKENNKKPRLGRRACCRARAHARATACDLCGRAVWDQLGCVHVNWAFQVCGWQEGEGRGGFDCSDDLYLLCGKAKERQQQQQQQEERERSGACASVCGGGKRGRRGGGQAVVWVGGGCDSRPVFPLAANLFKAQAIGSDVCVGRRGFALCSAGRRREGRAEAVTGRRAGCVQVVCVRRRRMRGRGVDGERGGGQRCAREKVCVAVWGSLCVPLIGGG